MSKIPNLLPSITLRFLIKSVTVVLMLVISACAEDADMERTFLELNPVPQTQIEAVQRALMGIEARNWDLYLSSFEPTTTLIPTHPGVPGHFTDLQYELISFYDQREDIVIVRGLWVPSQMEKELGQIGYDDKVYINFHIKVVKAKVSIPTNLSVPIVGNIGPSFYSYAEGWYIRWDEESLPFNLNALEKFKKPLGNVPGVFAVEREGDIFIVSTDGSRELQLTEGSDEDQSPMWAPNSDFIAFSRITNDGSNSNEVTRKCMWVNIHTQNVEGFDAEGKNCSHRSWLPNGNRLVADIWGEDISQDIVIDVEKNQLLFSTDNYLVDWTSNGEQILIKRNCQGDISTLTLYKLNTGDSELITDYPNCLEHAELSPYGDMIVLIVPPSQEEGISKNYFSLILHPTKTSGKTLAKKFNSPTDYENLRLSSSGKYIVYSKRDLYRDSYSIYLYDTLQMKVEKVWFGEDPPDNLVWAPDEHKLAFFTGYDTLNIYNLLTKDISKFPASMFERTRLNHLKWSPDSKWLIIRGFHLIYSNDFELFFLVNIKQHSVQYLMGSTRFQNEPQWIGNTNIIYTIINRDIDGDGIVDPLGEQPEQAEVILLDTLGTWRWVTKNNKDDDDIDWSEYELPEP